MEQCSGRSVRITQDMAAAASPAIPALPSPPPSPPNMRLYCSKPKRLSSSSSSSTSLLPRQALQLPLGNSPIQRPCTNEGGDIFEVGSYYEIDHGQLPPKSPTLLKDIRVVMVYGKTMLNVTVKFPSMQSLREYFRVENSSGVLRGKRKSEGMIHPELDEEFVMSTNHAARILQQMVPESEIQSLQHLEEFWMVTPRSYEEDVGDDGGQADETDGKGKGEKDLCLKALESKDLLRWGLKRRASYSDRRAQNGPAVDFAATRESREKSKVSRGKNGGWKCGKFKSKDVKERKKPKLHKEKPNTMPLASVPVGQNTSISHFKNSKDRWSSERYEAAELKLLSIMKQKKAVLGNPILRTELREEARKLIGDTGLLDHLLKHMAGKVVSDGRERFRRRHNPDGAMEYWLEDANLADLRKMAGIADTSCWAPPPGWKPGDGVSFCGSMACGLELAKLREEIHTLRREIEQLHCLKLQCDEQKNAKDSQSENGSNNMQENYESLLNWKTKVETELDTLIQSLDVVKEDVKLIRDEMKDISNKQQQEQDKKDEVEWKSSEDFEEGEEKKKGMQTSNCTTNGNAIKCSSTTAITAAAKNSITRTARKSGFRICKPQGTFLWPNMMESSGKSTVINGSSSAGGGGGTTTAAFLVCGGGGAGTGGGGRGASAISCMVSASPRSVVPCEDVFGVPTPPSASSVTSPPVLPLLAQPCNGNCEKKSNAVSSGTSRTHSSQGIIPLSRGAALLSSSAPGAGGRMEGGTGGWSSISTDLALASPSYLH